MDNLFSGGILLIAYGFLLSKISIVFNSTKNFIIRRLTMSLEVANDADMYMPLRTWTLKHTSVREKCRAFTPKVYYTSIGNAFESKRVIELHPTVGTFFIKYKNKRVIITTSRKEKDTLGGIIFSESLNFTFFTKDRSILDGIIAEAVKEYYNDDSDRTYVYIYSNGAWRSLGAKYRRAKETVILKSGMMDEIITDIESFSNARDLYLKKGIPWKRGILLYGPPGNGKTSAILSVAGELNKPIYIINLSLESVNDASLPIILADTSAGSIVVFEDIDCSTNDRSTIKDKDSSTLTLSGILNSLDGIPSQDGRIIFMTTNHIEKLDPALIRTGRVDRRFLIDYPDHDQIADMYKLHYEMEMPDRVKDGLNGNQIPMSDIQGMFISERDLDKVAQLLGGQDAKVI